jgi:hypothetical protein
LAHGSLVKLFLLAGKDKGINNLTIRRICGTLWKMLT